MNQSIQNGLNDLFDQIIPISRDFNKKTYADSFKNAYEKYKPLFAEIAQECENSGLSFRKSAAMVRVTSSP